MSGTDERTWPDARSICVGTSDQRIQLIFSSTWGHSRGESLSLEQARWMAERILALLDEHAPEPPRQEPDVKGAEP